MIPCEYWTSFCLRTYYSLHIFLFLFFSFVCGEKKNEERSVWAPNLVSVVTLVSSHSSRIMKNWRANLWFAVLKPWKFHRTVHKPRVPLSRRDDRPHREDRARKKWEKKKKNLGVGGIVYGVVCVEFPPFYCVFFIYFLQEFRLSTSDSLLCLQASSFSWSCHFSSVLSATL